MTSARPGRRLLAVAAAIALVLAAAGVALAWEGYRAARAAELEEISDAARAGAGDVGQFVNGRVQVLEALAGNDGILRGDGAAVDRRLELLALDELGFTAGLAWIDVSNRVRAAAGPARADAADEVVLRSALLRARSGGEAFISPALPPSLFPVSAVAVAVPTRDGRERVNGTLVAGMGVDWLNRIAAQLNPIRGGSTTIVDRAGQLIVAPGLTAVTPVGADPLVRRARALAEGRGSVRTGSAAGVRGLDGRGDQIVGIAFEPQRTGWVLVVGRDSGDALGDARRTLWLQIGGLALLTLVGVGGAALMARRLDRLAAERDDLLQATRRAEGRAAFLASAAAALDGEPRLADRLQRLADLCVPVLGDRARVELAPHDGHPGRAAQAPADESPPDGAGAALAAPLVVGGRAIGSLAVTRAGGAAYGSGDEELARRLAGQAALQLESARLYEREHEIAATLQRSLLPDALPPVEGLELAARYLPAGAAVEAGGDWYEAVPLPDGRVALAVGDVVGKGERAAAAMGQLRSALRVLALEGLGPADLLARLSAFAETVPEAACSTVAYALVDPRGGEALYACAGHPYPMVVPAGATVRLLTDGRGGPLAGPPSGRIAEGRVALGEGDLLVLYTDGLVELRREGLDAGFARLVQAAEGLRGARVEAFCDGLLTALGAADAAADDIALLVARRVPAGG